MEKELKAEVLITLQGREDESDKVGDDMANVIKWNSKTVIFTAVRDSNVWNVWKAVGYNKGY